MRYEYKILWGQDLQELQKQVQEHMKEGYQCQGGIAMAWVPSDRGDSVMEYAQAVVKVPEVPALAAIPW